MRRLAGLIIAGLILATTLAACAEATPPAPRPASTTPPAPVEVTGPATARPTFAATPSAESVLFPTATPPIILPATATVPPTRFPTATARPEGVVAGLGPSLTGFRTTKASFQTAFGKAAGVMANTNSAARLVLAQSTSFSLDRTVWTFFFTLPGGSRTWAVTYDSTAGKDKKEVLTGPSSSALLLPDEAGQWQASKVLDSDEISTRLERAGLPPELPIDTVYVQLISSTKVGRVPAYIYVNGSLNKQIIVHALTGAILQNDFL